MSHYYDYSGNPRHTYTGDGGEVKNTTPRTAWRRGWCPSVTTITHEFPSTRLMTWVAEQIAEAACNNPQLPGESDEAYMKKLQAIHRTQQARIMDFGTKVHEDCESIIQLWHQDYSLERMEFSGDTGYQAEAFAKWYAENWEKLRGTITDIKTQSVPFNVYPEHKMQLAAYADAMIDADGLETLDAPITEQVVVNRTYGYAGTVDYYWPDHWDCINDMRLVNIFISRDVPVQIKMHKHQVIKNVPALEEFRAALNHYQQRYGNVTLSPKWPENEAVEQPADKEVAAA